MLNHNPPSPSVLSRFSSSMASPEEMDDTSEISSPRKNTYKDPDGGRQRFLLELEFIQYPHCLYFLELLQNPNFRTAMAHPANKELAHRQQFYYWKNYRNNRLKHILPRPLPEPVAPQPPAAPSSTLPPAPSATAALSPALSPMQYNNMLAKNETRNMTSAGIDRRKRNPCPEADTMVPDMLSCVY
ncbi:unnamed protein product [Thlaspi arvense]|uniref:Mediator of RNA polymerase II transcription subunit 31 n=1 Tax=Thlaspi arvense TaxID=13288 RepID=A0AAU9SXA5_THLAR|nr:unnamed protein product [Thlaspi arvense]